MKTVLYSVIFLLLAFTLEGAQVPHLILHFDVNKTLIASDVTENKSMEDVINELLSRRYSACWDESVPDPITFDAYVRTVILPGAEHDARLKEQRLTHLVHFIDYLKEKNHPLYQTVLTEFVMILDQLKGSQGRVFPSFYRLITELNATGITYTLFLRSFGKEVFDVSREINSFSNGLITLEGIFRKGVLYLNGKEALSEPQPLHAFFNSKENAAIRDDWSYWMEGEMEARFGKPFPIDIENHEVLTLFFDDNIKLDSLDKNIIAPIDAKTGNPIPIDHLLKLKQLCSVNTIDAILNERYYLDHVQEALRLHRG